MERDGGDGSSCSPRSFPRRACCLPCGRGRAVSAGVFGDAWRWCPPAPCLLPCGPAQSALRSGHPWKTSSVRLGKQRGEETRHRIKSRGLTFYPCAPVPWVHPRLPPCDPPGGPGLTPALGGVGLWGQRGLLPPQPLFGFVWGSHGIMRAELGDGLSLQGAQLCPGVTSRVCQRAEGSSVVPSGQGGLGGPPVPGATEVGAWGKAPLCPFLCPQGLSGGSQALFSLSPPCPLPGARPWGLAGSCEE